MEEAPQMINQIVQMTIEVETASVSSHICEGIILLFLYPGKVSIILFSFHE